MEGFFILIFAMGSMLLQMQGSQLFTYEFFYWKLRGLEGGVREGWFRSFFSKKKNNKKTFMWYFVRFQVI